MKIFLITTTAILHLSCKVLAGEVDPFHETPREYAARAQWLRDAKIGVFVHWNPSSNIAQEISWSRQDYGTNKYHQLYKQVKGEKVNADAWEQLVDDAGSLYAVTLHKHHIRCCM